MDRLFGSLRGFIKIDHIVTDSFVFRLHHKLTVAILIGASLLVTSRQYFGDPIDCISRDDIPPNLLDTYCWIHGTFSVVDSWNKSVGVDIPYPGVDKYRPGEERRYHKYYQWVCFVLFFQAVCFYAPRYIWKIFEGNRLRTIMLGLDCPILVDAHKRREVLIKYFQHNLGGHRLYYSAYVVCEALAFLNVIIQMYLIDSFLGGEFMTYGSRVLSFTDWDDSVRYDPMIRVFPRLAKCTFHRYGSSGDVQKHDAMCILPGNIINEKIYIFLWFWFYLLGFLSFFSFVWRLSTYFFKKPRMLVSKLRSKICSQQELAQVFESLPVGDWYLVDLLAKNMDPVHFRDFICEFNDNFRKDYYSSSSTSRVSVDKA
jgi:hypothetical protein